MKNESIFKTRITPHFTLVIDTEDEQPPKTWKLCYTYGAIAKIEDAIGKDIKRIEAWQELSSGKDFPAIVWGGLDKYNPEVTLDEVKDILNPEAQRLLSDEIFELMFPGIREALKKDTGETADPNAQGTPNT